MIKKLVKSILVFLSFSSAFTPVVSAAVNTQPDSVSYTCFIRERTIQGFASNRSNELVVITGSFRYNLYDANGGFIYSSITNGGGSILPHMRTKLF